MPADMIANRSRAFSSPLLVAQVSPNTASLSFQLAGCNFAAEETMLTLSVFYLGTVQAADPSIMHLKDVSSGQCVATGVTGASGGVTLQPGCNVPSDNQVYAIHTPVDPACSGQAISTLSCS